MRIETDKNGQFELKEVYNPITLVTNAGERLSICMRDTGFEFYYNGALYSLKEEKLENLSKLEPILKDPEESMNQVYDTMFHQGFTEPGVGNYVINKNAQKEK